MPNTIAYLDESSGLSWERTLYAFLAEKERLSGLRLPFRERVGASQGVAGPIWRRSAWESRRVLVYATNARTRGITGRMDDILTRHGYRGAVMKTEAVAFQTAGEWVAIG